MHQFYELRGTAEPLLLELFDKAGAMPVDRNISKELMKVVFAQPDGHYYWLGTDTGQDDLVICPFGLLQPKDEIPVIVYKADAIAALKRCVGFGRRLESNQLGAKFLLNPLVVKRALDGADFLVLQIFPFSQAFRL